MKIAIRAGHNFSVPGVFGFIDETCENRRIKDEVIKYLDALDYEVLDVTSSDCYNTVESDLAYGVNSANEWNADIFISIHFNNQVKFYNGEIGCEVWVYDEKSKVYTVSKNICTNLSKAINTLNRGVKVSKKFSVLRKTKMPALLIEIDFISNPSVESNLASEKYIKDISSSISSTLLSFANIL